MADLAALHEAAEALAYACQHADAGRMFEAGFALEQSSLCALGAFEEGSRELEAWQRVLGVVDAEVTLEGAA